MKLKVVDDIYDFDLERMLISEAKEIKRNTGGMTILQFINGCMELDPDALQAAAFLAMTRAGDAVRFEDLAKLNAFDISVLEDDDPQAKAEDPTEPATGSDGTSMSTKSDTSTSGNSRNGGTSRRKPSTE